MRDLFTKNWIIEHSIEVCNQYEKGVLTLRALHYQLVGLGMTNDIQHYKRVVTSMIDARWDGIIEFDQFSDLDRTMIGETEYEQTVLEDKIRFGEEQVEAWMTAYRKNRWENQSFYPEVFIEKKALQGVFAPPCDEWNISLGACKGYPSLTFLFEAEKRFAKAAEEGKTPIILYFGDYDPSGEDIPRSIGENLKNLGTQVEVRRIALMEDQVRRWNLPPAPAKQTDSRTANWGGIGQVELDAVKPEMLRALLLQAITDIFDPDRHANLMMTERQERAIYTKRLKQFVNGLKD